MGHNTCGFHMTYIFYPILHLTRVSLSGKIHLVSLIFLSRDSGDCVMVSEGGVRHLASASANRSQRSVGRRLIVTDF